MNDFTIDLAQLEEWQMLNDHTELELLFHKAKSAIVQGEKVVLHRRNVDGTSYSADEFSTEAELETYRSSVFKYISTQK